MALEKSNIPIAFSQGLDTKTDPKQIPAGKFINLENAVFLKTGEIRKRNGFKQYVQNVNNPWACSTFKDQLFLLDKSSGFSYTPNNSTATSSGSYGPYDSGNVTKRVAVASSRSSQCAIDPVRKTALYAYETNNVNIVTGLIQPTISWALHDLDTGAKIIQTTDFFGRYPQVVTNEDMDYYVVAYENLNNTVNAGSFIPGTLYEIRTLGTTNWTAIGYVGVPTVGGRFVATGAGSGTGSAYVSSLSCFCVPKNPSSFNSAVFYNVSSTVVYSGYGFCLSDTRYPKIVWSAGNSGADTAINYFPLLFNTLPGSLPAPKVLAGTSCRVGASVSSSLFGEDLIALNDGINIRTIVYDSTLSTVLASLRVAMTATGSERYNGVVSFNLDGSSQNAWVLFTTQTTTGSTTFLDMPLIVRCIVAGGFTISSTAVYLLNAAISGPAFRVNPSYFEDSLKKRSYLPIKINQQFSTTLSVYPGQYTSYLINFWETNTDATQIIQRKTAKYLDLNTPQTVATVNYPLNEFKHFPDYVCFTSGYYSSGDDFYSLVPDSVGDSYLYKFSKDKRPTFAEIGNSLYVSGGILRMFDGTSFCEHNFLQKPLQVQFGSVASGAIPAGTYYYQITYEWRDAYGQVHISAPSLPSQITFSAASQVPINCSPLILTDKTTPVYIGIYRSNDGVLFYKMPNTGVGSSFVNRSFQFLTYNDNISNTALLLFGPPFLYTVGGELDNACAPACNFVGTYKRRLMLVPSEDTNSFWYSKEIIPTTADAIGEPVNFANEFIQSVNEEDGKVTGLAEMDDKLIIFKTSGISVTVGNGPAPNGLNNDFTLPQRLATDTGCLYGRSIILSPLGLMFQSPKGFYLLDRSLTVSYIGAPIEAYNSIECTAANLMYDRNEIWFALQDGKTIIFNYYFNQFSNFPNILGFGNNQHATVFKGAYVSVAQVLKLETPGIYQDVSSSNVATGYAMKVTTGWMSFAQVQGFQRVYKLLLLGDYKSSHRLQVQASVDFDDTVVQTSVITPTATPPYQYRFFMTRQKCEAVKFTIQDLAPTTGSWSEAYTLSNMAFEVGVKKGLNKLPASKSVG